MTRISRWACVCCISKQLPLQSASSKIHIWCETPPLTLAIVWFPLQIDAKHIHEFMQRKSLIKVSSLCCMLGQRLLNCLALSRSSCGAWPVFSPSSEDCSLHTFDASILTKQWLASRWARTWSSMLMWTSLSGSFCQDQKNKYIIYIYIYYIIISNSVGRCKYELSTLHDATELNWYTWVVSQIFWTIGLSMNMDGHAIDCDQRTSHFAGGISQSLYFLR